jgi:hypothetical protein
VPLVQALGRLVSSMSFSQFGSTVSRTPGTLRMLRLGRHPPAYGHLADIPVSGRPKAKRKRAE